MSESAVDVAGDGSRSHPLRRVARRSHAAVGKDGARLGKGGGFSDLELAVAAEAGLVDRSTVVVTTVHELQVRPAGAISTTAHDIHVDVVVTPERVIECARPRRYRAPRLRWGELTEEKIAAIPLLQRLR